MEFPEYNARTFRTNLQKLFPKDGYIDIQKAAQWLKVTPQTIKKWTSGKAKTPHNTWCLVYLAGSGDLSLYSEKWYGWYIDSDTIGSKATRYTSTQIESLKWFQLANARLIETTRALKKEVNALPWEKKKVQQDIDSARNEISETLKKLENRLNSDRSTGLPAYKEEKN